MQKSLHIDPDKCTGCLQCELACSHVNEGVFNPAKSRIKVFNFHDQGRMVPYTCTQCDEAWCMRACPVDAITLDSRDRRQGGLRRSAWAARSAPLPAPSAPSITTPTGKVIKCDLCEGDPACATACPTDAITYIDANLDRPRPDARSGRPRPTPASKPPAKAGRIMSWAGTCTDALTSVRQAAAVRAAQHGLGPEVPGPARAGHQISGGGDRSQGRPAVARQQDDHDHGAADRHLRLDGRALFGGDQGRADRRHRLLQLRRLLRQRDEERRLGHDHLRRARRPRSRSISWSRTTRPSCSMPASSGAPRCGTPKRASRPSTRIRNIRVASIGISRARRACKFACVVNDMDRAAGRSGVGTVMGSKNLKAVAVRGTLGVKVKDFAAFMEAT